MEERSERECTALDAHKELEMVSCASSSFLPSELFSLSGHLPSGPASSSVAVSLEIANSFLISAFAIEKSLRGAWLAWSGEQVTLELRVASSSPTLGVKIT